MVWSLETGMNAAKTELTRACGPHKLSDQHIDEHIEHDRRSPCHTAEQFSVSTYSINMVLMFDSVLKSNEKVNIPKTSLGSMVVFEMPVSPEGTLLWERQSEELGLDTKRVSGTLNNQHSAICVTMVWLRVNRNPMSTGLVKPD